MNKAQLIDAIQKNLGEGASKKCAASALDAVLSAISAAVKKEKVSLIGFGTFETKERPARTGRNPKTGETMQIPASTTVCFKPSSALKA